MDSKALKDDLIRKIYLQRGVHSYFEHRWKVQNIILKSTLIVLPAILVFATFSDFDFLQSYISKLSESDIRLFVGIISFILFITGILSEIFQISIIHEKHRDAIERYSELLRNIREAGSNISEYKISALNQQYISISSNTIHISSKRFGKAEKQHLKQSAMRKIMKKNPFRFNFQIRREAKNEFQNIDK